MQNGLDLQLQRTYYLYLRKNKSLISLKDRFGKKSNLFIANVLHSGFHLSDVTRVESLKERWK